MMAEHLCPLHYVYVKIWLWNKNTDMVPLSFVLLDCLTVSPLFCFPHAADSHFFFFFFPSSFFHNFLSSLGPCALLSSSFLVVSSLPPAFPFTPHPCPFPVFSSSSSPSFPSPLLSSLRPQVGQPSLVLLLECSADTLTGRLQQRARTALRSQDGRDAEQDVQRRVESFCSSSRHVVSHYKHRGLLHKVREPPLGVVEVDLVTYTTSISLK